MKWAALLDSAAGEAIRSQLIPAPIVIVGPPRSGTTFLHRAIALHPEVRFLPYFEALEPVAPAGLPPEEMGSTVDPRVFRTDMAMKIIHWLRPLFQQMHVMGAHV